MRHDVCRDFISSRVGLLAAFVSLFILSPFARAQSVSFPETPKENRILGINGGLAGEVLIVPRGEAVPVSIPVKNLGTVALEITHICINSTQVFLPIPSLSLSVGEQKSLAVVLDSEHMQMPTIRMAQFRFRDATGSHVESAYLKFYGADSFVVQPLALTWQLGAAIEDKTLKIAYSPPNVKLVSVRSSNPSFEARVENGAIVVKVDSTQEPKNAMLNLVTDPVLAHSTNVPVRVMAPQKSFRSRDPLPLVPAPKEGN